MSDLTFRLWQFGVAHRKVRVKKGNTRVIIWFFPINGKLNFYIYPSIPTIFKLGKGGRTLEGITDDIERIVKEISLMCIGKSGEIKKRNLKRITVISS